MKRVHQQTVLVVFVFCLLFIQFQPFISFDVNAATNTLSPDYQDPAIVEPIAVCCFPAGTTVKMADGSSKNIEKINTGDQVLSYNPQKKSYNTGEVTRTVSPLRYGVYEINNGLIEITDDHPLYVRKSDGRMGWAAINQQAASYSYRTINDILTLEIGDKLFSLNKKWVKIRSIDYQPGPIETYSFSVSGSHTFFVNGILAHNATYTCPDDDNTVIKKYDKYEFPSLSIKIIPDPPVEGSYVTVYTPDADTLSVRVVDSSTAIIGDELSPSPSSYPPKYSVPAGSAGKWLYVNAKNFTTGARNDVHKQIEQASTSNNPPFAPSNPSPSDGATEVSVNTQLNWEGGDPDGDPVTYWWNGLTTGSTQHFPTSVSPPVNPDQQLEYDTTYYWQIKASDGSDETLGPKWSFTTEKQSSNKCPEPPSNPSPSNGASSVSTSPSLSVAVSDPNGDTMDVTFYDASDGSSIGTDTDVSSGGTASVVWSELSYSTSYSWYATANDGSLSSSSSTFSFTTKEETNNIPDKPTPISPDNDANDVTTDPVLKATVSDPNGDTMDVTFYDASDGSSIGTDTDVSSGGTASVVWSGLSYSTSYSWYATANDGLEESQKSSTWSFTTESEGNDQPKKPSNPSPSNGAWLVNTSPSLSVYVEDPDDDTMDVTFYDASDGSSIGTDTDVSSGGTASVVWSGLSYSTSYSWYAVADDGTDSTQSSTWSFTTESEGNDPPKKPYDPFPSNRSTSISVNVDLSWNCSDLEEDPLSYDVYLGTKQGISKLSSNQTKKNLSLSNLYYNTTYYWFIQAWDSHGANTTSPLWEFTTEKQTTSATLNLTFPNGYEKLLKGKTHNITWESTGNVGDNIKIILYENSTNTKIDTISQSTANDGSYPWHIPANHQTGNKYFIIIRSTKEPTIYDGSKEYFSITDETTLNIFSPVKCYEKIPFQIQILDTENNPVSEATVLFANQQRKTDEQGNVVFDAPETIQDFQYFIFANKTGYDSSLDYVVIKNINLKIEPSSEIVEAKKTFNVTISFPGQPEFQEDLQGINIKFNGTVKKTDKNGRVTFTAPATKKDTLLNVTAYIDTISAESVILIKKPDTVSSMLTNSWAIFLFAFALVIIFFIVILYWKTNASPENYLNITAPIHVDEGTEFTIKIRDHEGNPIPEATVEFNNVRKNTDYNGVVAFQAPLIDDVQEFYITAWKGDISDSIPLLVGGSQKKQQKLPPKQEPEESMEQIPVFSPGEKKKAQTPPPDFFKVPIKQKEDLDKINKISSTSNDMIYRLVDTVLDRHKKEK